MTWFFISPPLEQSIQSQPRLFNSRANTTDCSRSHPPSIQSVHEMRTPRGLLSGHAARAAARIGEFRDERLDLGAGERARDEFAVAHGNRRRGDRLPSSFLGAERLPG